jgi:hypothetical protein
MLKKLRFYSISIILGLSMVSCEVYRLSAAAVVQETATPAPRMKTLAALETQPGNTDIIVILGILLFAFIAIPIMLHYKDWHSS